MDGHLKPAVQILAAPACTIALPSPSAANASLHSVPVNGRGTAKLPQNHASNFRTSRFAMSDLNPGSGGSNDILQDR